MKLERISENQIRCTLTKSDLVEHHILLSELAYGSERAKSLFREMLSLAYDELGFETDGLPLMIEAIPVNAECIILLVTKVEDPEELDARFSRFTKPFASEQDDDEVDEEAEERGYTESAEEDEENADDVDDDPSLNGLESEDPNSTSSRILEFLKNSPDEPEAFIDSLRETFSDYVADFFAHCMGLDSNSSNVIEEADISDSREVDTDSEFDAKASADAETEAEVQEKANAETKEKADAKAKRKALTGQASPLKPVKEKADLYRIFVFESLEYAMKAASHVRDIYAEENSLFQNPSDSKFYLVLNQGELEISQFNLVCNTISEFGAKVSNTYGTLYYMQEHFKPIVDKTAIQTLAKL